MAEETKSAFKSFLTDELKKWIVRTLLFIAASTFLWLSTPLRSKVNAIWNSPEQLEIIQHQLTRLTESLDKATGENRVIKQYPGQSYVTEPVTRGEDVTYNLVLQRTALGANCKLLSRQALFTDQTGVPTPGEVRNPIRQISTEATRLKMTITPPVELLTGRIELYVLLEYTCDGKFVPDRTDSVYYNLLEEKTK